MYIVSLSVITFVFEYICDWLKYVLEVNAVFFYKAGVNAGRFERGPLSVSGSATWRVRF